MTFPDFKDWLQRKCEWSLRTFGPGQRSTGVIKHIKSELDEIQADPKNVVEWMDVVLLAFDGAYRAGHSAKEILDALLAKQEKNEKRDWPPPGSRGPDESYHHVKIPQRSDLKTENGKTIHPVATFNDGYSHWCIDDRCYVLYNGENGEAMRSYHLFPEAIEVLKNLPSTSEVEKAWYPEVSSNG